MQKKKQTYSADGLTVTFDPNICVHSAICLRNLPSVFDISKKRWVRPENAPSGKVVEVVRRCPSGALQYAQDEEVS